MRGQRLSFFYNQKNMETNDSIRPFGTQKNIHTHQRDQLVRGSENFTFLIISQFHMRIFYICLKAGHTL